MNAFAKYLTTALLPALALGCASAKYIDEGGDDSIVNVGQINTQDWICLLYTSPSPRDLSTSRMPSSA